MWRYCLHPRSRPSSRQAASRRRCSSTRRRSFMRGFASVRNSAGYRQFIASALMLLAAFCVSAAELKRVDAVYFTFDVPRDMVKMRAQGIDSHVGDYRNSRIRLGFDYGVNSDPLDYDNQLPAFQSSKLEIDGRSARIV